MREVRVWLACTGSASYATPRDQPLHRTHAGRFKLRQSNRIALAHAGAGAVTLLAPVVSYLVYEQYPVWTAEVACLVGIALVAGAGLTYLSARAGPRAAIVTLACLCALAIDGIGTLDGLWCLLIPALLAAILRARFASFVFVGFSVFIVAAVALPEPGPVVQQTTTFNASTAKGRGAPVVHLVLDEHTGSAGIPRDLPNAQGERERVEDTFTGFGLRVHSRAYSELFETDVSLSRVFNPRHTGNPRRFVGSLDGNRTLRRNDYFNHLAALGYRFTVIQSSYLDFCAGAGKALASCTTYPSNAIRDIAGLSVPALPKLSSIMAHKAIRYRTFHALRALYRKHSHRAEALGLALPAWDWDGGLTASINAMAVWPRVLGAAQNLSSGDVLFAHLMVPHHPYVFDAQCRASPDLYRRLDMADESLPGPETNTTSGRKLRWRLYLAQTRCVESKIEQLMGVLQQTSEGKRATVVIHGDHGARITTLFPFLQFEERLSGEGLRDSYSTLFAWKREDSHPGIDRCPRSTRELLGAIMHSPGTAVHCDADQPQTVLLEDTRNGSFISRKVRSTLR